MNDASQPTHCGCSSPSSKYECVTRCGDVKDVNYDTDGAYEGQYGCQHGPIWVHVMADMGSLEWAVMGLEAQAIFARETKNFVTILV